MLLTEPYPLHVSFRTRTRGTQSFKLNSLTDREDVAKSKVRRRLQFSIGSKQTAVPGPVPNNDQSSFPEDEERPFDHIYTSVVGRKLSMEMMTVLVIRTSGKGRV